MNRAMTDGEAIEAVERDMSLAKLGSYLRQQGPLTSLLRGWLVDLLEEDRARSGSRFKLSIGRRQGRSLSNDERQEHSMIYQRYVELAGEEITRALCDGIAAEIRHRVRNEPVGNRVTYLIVQGAYIRHKLIKGKRLSQAHARRIVAAEFKRSAAGIRKIVERLAKDGA